MKLINLKDHDFCKDVRCKHYCEVKTVGVNENDRVCLSEKCTHSAKEFHKWLNKNGYAIVRVEL